MPRKRANFLTLINYIEQGSNLKDFLISNNLELNCVDMNKESIAKQFINNDQLIERNSPSFNHLYHEIVSIRYNPELSKERHRVILYELVSSYIDKRAKYNMVYGLIHDEKNNFHCHLVISSNEFQSSKRHYLSKSEFANIKRELEQELLTKYPELNEPFIHNKEVHSNIKSNRVSENEYQMEKRTGKPSKRKEIQLIVETLITKAGSRKDFIKSLHDNGITFTSRGKNVVFLFKEHHYRLNRLDSTGELLKQYLKLPEINNELFNEEEKTLFEDITRVIYESRDRSKDIDYPADEYFDETI